jgi:hypothetical protein
MSKKSTFWSLLCLKTSGTSNPETRRHIPEERITHILISLPKEVLRYRKKQDCEENTKNEKLCSLDGVIVVTNWVGAIFFSGIPRSYLKRKNKSPACVLARFVRPRKLSVVSRFHHPPWWTPSLSSPSVTRSDEWPCSIACHGEMSPENTRPTPRSLAAKLKQR